MSGKKDILWAPWRHSYILRNIKSHKKGKKHSCFLCDAWADPKSDPSKYVLMRTDKVLVILNRFPYNNGHLMIAPGRHVEDISKASAIELQEMTAAMQTMVSCMKKVLNPHGFNIGMNIGFVSGAGERHIHLHIVPRWTGDTNFMPIFTPTKVMSQSLKEVYTQLRKALKK